MVRSEVTLNFMADVDFLLLKSIDYNESGSD